MPASPGKAGEVTRNWQCEKDLVPMKTTICEWFYIQTAQYGIGQIIQNRALQLRHK